MKQMQQYMVVHCNPVVERVPDMWGDQWQEHLKKEQTADTLGDL
jgi:hypothetical protein